MVAPAAKFYALVTSLTIAIMLGVLTWVAPLLRSLGTCLSLGAAVAGLLTSVGVYRIIALGAGILIRWCGPARRWVFGGTYLHGTWVGHFVGRAGDRRLMIEHID